MPARELSVYWSNLSLRLAFHMQAFFDNFFVHLDSHQLTHTCKQIQPRPHDGGSLETQNQYEGGFVLITVHAQG